MSIILEPWFLVLFAVAASFFFYSLREKGNDGATVIDLRLSKWIVLGIGVVIAIFLLFKVIQGAGFSPHYN